MASGVKSLRVLWPSHVALAILSILTGIASMYATDYNIGVFGMGIWLGGWILLTGLAGMASAKNPGNYCRIGTFLGCCLVAIVVLSICSIVLGTVVIKHFQFESTVTREYYKDKGVFGARSHEDYFKREQYFKDRHKTGKVGLGVYSFLLVIIVSDILLCFASVYVCRDITLGHGQAAGGNNGRTSPSTRRVQANPAAIPGELGLAGQNWAELVFQQGNMQPIHLIQNSEFQFFTPYKLPNYAELYPEGIPNPAVSPNQEALVSNVPDEPPPAYTPTANTSLPGSSVVVPLGANLSPAEEHSIVQESTTLDRTVTSPELLEVANLSSEHPGMLELSSEYPGSSTPVHSLHSGDFENPRSSTPVLSLHPGDLENPGSSTPVLSLHPRDSETPFPVVLSSLEPSLSTATPGQITPLPNTLIMTDSSTREFQNCVESDSPGSLPNSIEVESQNETTNLEMAAVATETR